MNGADAPPPSNGASPQFPNPVMQPDGNDRSFLTGHISATVEDTGDNAMVDHLDEHMNAMQKLDAEIGIKRSTMQQILHALCESGPVTAVVLSIVFAAIAVGFMGVEAPVFETGVTVFFIIEQSTKIWAMTPSLFFRDK